MEQHLTLKKINTYTLVDFMDPAAVSSASSADVIFSILHLHVRGYQLKNLINTQNSTNKAWLNETMKKHYLIQKDISYFTENILQRKNPRQGTISKILNKKTGEVICIGSDEYWLARDSRSLGYRLMGAVAYKNTELANIRYRYGTAFLKNQTVALQSVAIGNETILNAFLFKVSSKRIEKVKEEFIKYIEEENLFSIMAYEDNLIIVLDPTSRNFAKISKSINSFF